MIPHRLMTFDPFVRFSSKKDKLAIRCPQAPKGATRPMGKIKQNEEVNEGNDEALTPAQGFLKGPQRNEICLMLMGQINGMGNGDVGKTGVGINKKQVIPFGFPGKLMARPRLAYPPLW